MADEELPEAYESGANDENKLAWWSPKRIYDFGKNIVSLEASVSVLKEENRQLRVQVSDLQSQVDHMSGQLKILTGFVDSAIFKNKQ